MDTKNLKRISCEYIRASELFDELPKLWATFVASESDFTWGHNDITLVSSSALLSELKELEGVDAQFKLLKQRCRQIEPKVDFYIDLES